MTATVAELHPDRQAAAPDFRVDIEAEQALIGAVLAGAASGRDVLSEVHAPTLTTAFAIPEHRDLWAVLLDLAHRGQPLTVESVFDAARGSARCPTLRASTLVDWIGRVADWYGAPSLARHYADRIRAAHVRRQLIALAGELTITAQSDRRPLPEWLPDLTAPLVSMRVAREADRTLGQEIVAVVDEIDARAEGRGVTGVPTGLRGIDQLIGGCHAGHLIVIAGRTGMGKTSFALTVAHQALRAGIGVGVVSCEMSRGELLERLLAQSAGLELTRIKRGYLGSEDRRRVHQAAAAVADWPLQIEDHERQWPAVELSLRRMVGNGAALLIVDYLGLLHLPGKQPRWEQIGVIIGDLKRLAVLLRVPILVLCQINREVARERDKRPALWHLRDSGAVEQDADTVILLHRPALVGDSLDREHAEAIVAKHRHGPTGSVNLRWVGAQATFTDGLADPWTTDD